MRVVIYTIIQYIGNKIHQSEQKGVKKVLKRNIKQVYFKYNRRENNKIHL